MVRWKTMALRQVHRTLRRMERRRRRTHRWRVGVGQASVAPVEEDTEGTWAGRAPVSGDHLAAASLVGTAGMARYGRPARTVAEVRLITFACLLWLCCDCLTTVRHCLYLRGSSRSMQRELLCDVFEH